jgi:uncharacterized protein
MLKQEYDTAIIGAGPAGLFAAYEYTQEVGTTSSVAILDKGGGLEQRICPFGPLRVCSCRNCTVNEGLMGAGLFSDGKLHFHPEIIEVDKIGLITPDETSELLRYTEGLFEEWGLDSPVYPTSNDAAVQLSANVQALGLGGGFELQVKKRTRHIGSDMLPALVGRMLTQIGTQGDMALHLRSNVLGIDHRDGTNILTVQNAGEIHRVAAGKVIVGLGRRGSYQVQDLIDKFSVPYTYQPVRIGGRVELPYGVMRNITDINYNPCFRQLREGVATFTFCANPQGFLTLESLLPNIAGINGESKAKEKTPFTNFAVLTELPVPPGENPNHFLKHTLDGNFRNVIPLVQTTADFVQGTEQDEHRPYTSTAGKLQYANIARIFPPEVTREIGDLLLKIDQVCPGVVSHDALFVAPEAKISGIEVAPINKRLETNVPGLHLIGDAAGLSRNIVAAAITGILAGRKPRPG